ncbi:paraquat-inducible protein A [Ruegeria sp. Ofav3-42]|uniref:paraquat-inducible protein A n=1 Tax=Ruegeria sp. Ofav3-42 TaxID=2917759 RepID=UPI001EF50BE4|nr:paraquat-inducible protein A [Ruegeria sp. Ofav3-42]MCG7518328.1 paraquat-inducible protein A [Ruegeria sp. Ofav3-42]
MQKDEASRRFEDYQDVFRHDPDMLIACPACDTLHVLQPVEPGQVARCTRCHFKLVAPKKDSLNRSLALALTSVVLMITMLNFPFLKMSKSGLSHEATIVQIITGLAHGWYVILAAAVALFVVAVPMIRAGALFYVMWALKQDKVPSKARRVFLFAEKLSPWAMTEIFIIGTGVALIKVAGLASISFGIAFWLFCALVVVIGLKNSAICRWTVWSLIRKGEHDQSM